MNPDYVELAERIMAETQCRSMTDDPTLVGYAEELAAGVTPERDAEIANSLPVPYQKKVPATAQLDGDELTIPRCMYIQASKVGEGEWNTATRGLRLGREKADCAIGIHTEYNQHGVTILRIVILWRRAK